MSQIDQPEVEHIYYFCPDFGFNSPTGMWRYDRVVQENTDENVQGCPQPILLWTPGNTPSNFGQNNLKILSRSWLPPIRPKIHAAASCIILYSDTILICFTTLLLDFEKSGRAIISLWTLSLTQAKTKMNSQFRTKLSSFIIDVDSDRCWWRLWWRMFRKFSVHVGSTRTDSDKEWFEI